MPDKGFQEKTEQPTQKKYEDARKEGQVAKSVELNSAVVLMTSIIVIYFMMGEVVTSLSKIFGSVYREAGIIEINPAMVLPFFIVGLKIFTAMVAPIILTILFMGILSSVAQIGPLLSLKAIMPKWEKISPASGFKRMFSQRSVVEALKGILKVVIIGYIGYLTIRSSFDEYITLMYRDVGPLMQFLGSMVMSLAFNITIALIILAVFDFSYQKWKYRKDLMMTKQEAKDEHKETDGDPLVKGRIRSAQRELSRRRMMQHVPEADVIITNPTTIAIALKYDVTEMPAPIVLAKGMRKLAERIKEVGKENGVPIIENKMLARALYKSVEPGDQIPFDLFQAVAEILAYIYRLKKAS